MIHYWPVSVNILLLSRSANINFYVDVPTACHHILTQYQDLLFINFY